MKLKPRTRRTNTFSWWFCEPMSRELRRWVKRAQAKVVRRELKRMIEQEAA